MDAVKTVVLWPLSVAKSLLLISCGALIAVIPLLFRTLSAGPSSLQKFTDLFRFFDQLPLGQVVFSSIVYLFAPYSTNIGCQVRKLQLTEESISSTVTMEDQPWLRNPFGSIHAIALANIGELASGLCLVSAMQHLPLKGIPVRIDTAYYRKARGTITASCSISLRKLAEAARSPEFIVETILTDSKGVEVGKTSVTWALKERSSLKKEK